MGHVEDGGGRHIAAAAAESVVDDCYHCYWCFHSSHTVAAAAAEVAVE